MPAPGYSAYVAPEKYATLGWILFGGEHGREAPRSAVRPGRRAASTRVGVPRTLKEAGVAEAEFEAALPDLARTAFADPSLRTNPRMPMINEIIGLLRQGFDGRPA